MGTTTRRGDVDGSRLSLLFLLYGMIFCAWTAWIPAIKQAALGLERRPAQIGRAGLRRGRHRRHTYLWSALVHRYGIRRPRSGRRSPTARR